MTRFYIEAGFVLQHFKKLNVEQQMSVVQCKITKLRWLSKTFSACWQKHNIEKACRKHIDAGQLELHASKAIHSKHIVHIRQMLNHCPNDQ